MLPTPRYVVFYVGERDRPDREEMRLSDAFLDGPGDVEVVATAVNVNAGRNPELLASCEALAGYARLVELIREGRTRGLDLDGAVEAAVRQCLDEGVLADYLGAKRAEVADMFLTEYDEAKTMELFREEGRAEGRAEERDGFLAATAGLVRSGSLTLRDASAAYGFSESEIARYL